MESQVWLVWSVTRLGKDHNSMKEKVSLGADLFGVLMGYNRLRMISTAVPLAKP